jgi:hypothetical protein
MKPPCGQASPRLVRRRPRARFGGAEPAEDANDVAAPQVVDARRVLARDGEDVETKPELRDAVLGDRLDDDLPPAVPITLGGAAEPREHFRLAHGQPAERGRNPTSGVPPSPALLGHADREGRGGEQRDDDGLPACQEAENQRDESRRSGGDGRRAGSAAAHRAGEERGGDRCDRCGAFRGDAYAFGEAGPADNSSA